MNTLTSEHRKLAYIIAIIVLLIPVIWLGMPSTGEDGSGGELAKLRVEHELGESTLGDVDPSSASMNFVLLGLRGIATNLLWMDANEHQKKKEWAKLRSTVDSIILLQPHYMKVWDFQGWNLAYNVSAEWDAVEDRYFWVKEGIKFLNEGVTRNERFPELDWKVGNLHGQKVGRSDEWRLFRKFYKVDPDTERFENGPDPEINP
ncbi:MAG: IRE (iron responsive element), partial [Planctomycetes bacterium]|nr:IRE (iron responsive element) [Planctomycetota bacterium]